MHMTRPDHTTQACRGSAILWKLVLSLTQDLVLPKPPPGAAVRCNVSASYCIVLLALFSRSPRVISLPLTRRGIEPGFVESWRTPAPVCVLRPATCESKGIDPRRAAAWKQRGGGQEEGYGCRCPEQFRTWRESKSI